jgi:hypothetical protein
VEAYKVLGDESQCEECNEGILRAGEEGLYVVVFINTIEVESLPKNLRN